LRFTNARIEDFVLDCFWLVSVAAQDTPADNWSQFRGNHSLTGVSQSNVPASLKQLWTYEAGESIESSAAIVGGTVFVGSQKGELVALSLENGSVYWKFSTGNPSASRHRHTAAAWSTLEI
jgi:outer membrane protein assembly factor BamB